MNFSGITSIYDDLPMVTVNQEIVLKGDGSSKECFVFDIHTVIVLLHEGIEYEWDIESKVVQQYHNDYIEMLLSNLTT